MTKKQSHRRKQVKEILRLADHALQAFDVDAVAARAQQQMEYVPLSFEELARRLTDAAEECNRLNRIAAQRSDMIVEAYVTPTTQERTGRIEYSIARRIVTSAGFKPVPPKDATDTPEGEWRPTQQ